MKPSSVTLSVCNAADMSGAQVMADTLGAKVIANKFRINWTRFGTTDIVHTASKPGGWTVLAPQ